MSGVSGDFEGMGQVRRLLQSLASGTWRHELAERVGGEGLYLVAEEFRTATGPNGIPWEPSARALREGGLTLSDKRVLGGSFSYQITPRGVVLLTNDKRAATHNWGDQRTHTIRGKPREFVFPRRQIIPDGGGGSWGVALEGVIRDFLEDKVKL